MVSSNWTLKTFDQWLAVLEAESINTEEFYPIEFSTNLFSLSCGLGELLKTGDGSRYWQEIVPANVMPIQTLKSAACCFGTYSSRDSYTKAKMFITAIGY